MLLLAYRFLSELICYCALLLFRQVGRFFPQLSADLQRQVRAHFPATTTVTAAAAGAEEDELDLHMYGVSAVDQPSPPQDATIKGEEESGQISRRLWQYLLRRQGIEDPQIRWGQLSAQAILGLAQEITQGRFAVDGKDLPAWLELVLILLLS